MLCLGTFIRLKREHPHFRDCSSGLQRTDISGDSDSGRSRSRHAVACETEAAAVRICKQCCAEDGRRTARAVCLPVANRLGTGDQCYVARKLGRPDCGFSDNSSRRLGS